MISGEEHAWRLLKEFSPEEISRKADVQFDLSSYTYICQSFGQKLYISVKDEKISSNSAIGNFLVNNLSYLSKLSILWYLIQAKEISLSGNLVKPSKFQGGNIYLKGSHKLPLDTIAEKFGKNSEEFFYKGMTIGGCKLGYGDFSLQLLPFPRVPVVFIIWKGDEEFPSNCSLLVDSTCELHLPIDIIWATVMMSTNLMLQKADE